MSGDWRDVAIWLIGHFLWQGTAIAFLTWLVVRRTESSEERASILFASLLAMLISPVVTYVFARLAGLQQPTLFGVEENGAFVRPFAWYWLAGVTISAARYSGGWLRLRAMLKRHTQPAEAALVEQVQRVASAIGFRRPVKVLVANVDLGPATFGIWRHVLIVPASAISRLSPDQLEAILAHELAHMLRNDFLIGLMVGIAESLLFFHPAVWWISSEIQKEREHCCDQIALEFAGSPVRYANALLGLAESHALAPSMAATGGTLTERVRRLRSQPQSKSRRSSLIAILIPAVAFLLAASVSPSSVKGEVSQFSVELAKPAYLVEGAPGNIGFAQTARIQAPLKTVRFIRIMRWTAAPPEPGKDVLMLTTSHWTGEKGNQRAVFFHTTDQPVYTTMTTDMVYTASPK